MKHNIIFLLIDSFNSRNCFGNEKTSITPNIDSLISNGVYFDQVITCASTTVPSICSMFTGTYPFDATVLDGNHYKLNTKIQNFVSILGKERAKEVLSAINKGQSIILLIDQKDSAGSEVKLFNYNVKTQIGFLKIAKKNNLKLIPVQLSLIHI